MVKHTKTAAIAFAFLLFCVTHAVAQTPQPSPDPALPTLFVVGDSTANNNANGAQGWGDPFVRLFDAKKINVVNRARAGRSSRTFLTEGLWDKVLQDVKRGDFVLIQFGHNDGGPLDTGRARGSLPGLGEETKEITKPDGTKEVVHTFGWYNRKFISDVRAKGATPVILSVTVRNIWKDGKVERGSGKFREWAEELARAEGVRFVDVTSLTADRYEAFGQEKVKEFFGPDHTHTSPAGAELNATLVAEGLRRLKGDPLGKYFK
ncbi:MAG TPA: rhamnogalacturonan acetylesterase [Pyrinomonadaceae bacterium]|nr:rhamnogalacturonan acetylesterase [Pyrinomonadaceae bacterium]